MKRKKKNRKKEATCPKKQKNKKKKKKSNPTWRQGNVSAQRRRKKNKATWRSPCAHGHFCQSRKNSFPHRFFSILGRKHFGGPREKHLVSPFIFLPSYTTKYTPKMLNPHRAIKCGEHGAAEI